MLKAVTCGWVAVSVGCKPVDGLLGAGETRLEGLTVGVGRCSPPPPPLPSRPGLGVAGGQ